MADGDYVMLGIGHAQNPDGAVSPPLTGDLIALANQHKINLVKGCLTEWNYNNRLATLIKEKLKAFGLNALTFNRNGGADHNGNGTGPASEVNKINEITKQLTLEGKSVKCGISLHLNSAGATATGVEYETWPSRPEQKKLADTLYSPIVKLLGIPTRGDAHYPRLGKYYGTGPAIPFTCFETFFISNLNDVRKGLEKFEELAETFAQAFKDYCDGNYHALTPEEAQKISVVKSSSLAPKAIKEKFDEHQIKEAALSTQKNLNDLERHMGSGGNRYSFYTKNATETVGTTPIPFDSSLVDDSGNTIKKMFLRDGGICDKYVTYPKYQAIDYTSNVPTGHKNLVVHSRYSVKTYETDLNASGWIRINAGGNIRLASSQQIDLISENNFNLEAGAMATFTSPEFSFSGNMTVNGTMQVAGSVMSSGPAYVGGGISAPSFNGPKTIDKTNKQELYGYMAGELESSFKMGDGVINLTGYIEFPSTPVAGQNPCTIVLTSGSGKVTVDQIKSGKGSDSAAMVKIPAHLHYFYRLNGQLGDSIVDIQKPIQSSMNN